MCGALIQFVIVIAASKDFYKVCKHPLKRMFPSSKHMATDSGCYSSDCVPYLSKPTCCSCLPYKQSRTTSKGKLGVCMRTQCEHREEYTQPKSGEGGGTKILYSHARRFSNAINPSSPIWSSQLNMGHLNKALSPIHAVIMSAFFKTSAGQRLLFSENRQNTKEHGHPCVHPKTHYSLDRPCRSSIEMYVQREGVTNGACVAIDAWGEGQRPNIGSDKGSRQACLQEARLIPPCPAYP